MPDTDPFTKLQTRAHYQELAMRTEPILAQRVRPSESGDEAFDTAFNAGREAVLTAARTSRNPLAGILSGSERQELIAFFHRLHRDTTGEDRNEVTKLAHKLGLHHDG